MSQKLTLTVYLEQKGQKAKALKRVEAEAFGIEYPLRTGWPGRHGEMEITAQMLEQIATAPRAKPELGAKFPPDEDHCKGKILTDNVTRGRLQPLERLSAFNGFIMRPAKRYRIRESAAHVRSK